MKTVIFVGSHPDDIELGCGGTVAKYAQRPEEFEVFCIYLTKGQRCGDPAVRTQESIDACGILGVAPAHVFFGRFVDTRVPESIDVIEYLEDFYVAKENAQAVIRRPVYAAFIHTYADLHQDHRAAAQCCRTAFRHAPRIFAYESPSSTGEFHPTTYVDITAYKDTKWEALCKHDTQISLERPYMEYEAMVSLSRYRGMQAKVHAAEAFETVKNVL